jgi:hypothetical protein
MMRTCKIVPRTHASEMLHPFSVLFFLTQSGLVASPSCYHVSIQSSLNLSPPVSPRENHQKTRQAIRAGGAGNILAFKCKSPSSLPTPHTVHRLRHQRRRQSKPVKSRSARALQRFRQAAATATAFSCARAHTCTCACTRRSRPASPRRP